MFLSEDYSKLQPGLVSLKNTEQPSCCTRAWSMAVVAIGTGAYWCPESITRCGGHFVEVHSSAVPGGRRVNPVSGADLTRKQVALDSESELHTLSGQSP